MPKIEASVDIHRLCADVFAVVMAPANAPRYDPAVLRSKTLDGQPMHLGSRVRIVARFVLDIPSTVISEVTEERDGGEMRCGVFISRTGWVCIRGVHTVVPVFSGAHSTWSREWDQIPRPLGSVLNLALQRRCAGKPQPPFDTLKPLLETSGLAI
jgi:hypothetical protein